MFDSSEISALLKTISETDFDDVELKAGDLYIRLRTNSEAECSSQLSDHVGLKELGASYAGSAPVMSGATSEDMPELVEVRSTTLGTFYAAPSPGAVPFVKVGDRVSATQQVGLVEVMKLFNAIEAGVDGVIETIQVQDAVLVEYGEVLMTIRPDNT